MLKQSADSLEASTELKSPHKYCQSILECIKLAQIQIKKEPADFDLQAYEEALAHGRAELDNLNKVVASMPNKQNLLDLNLKLLINYYRFLFSKATEEKSPEALSELKYHILEIMAAWK
jgi:hypothetical protein